MGTEEPLIQLPPPPDDQDFSKNGCQLWVGNLDFRITEFQLLKILQKHGTLERYDFVYHKVGPDQGKPRGYCFATYATKEEAEKAKLRLNGKYALSKRLVVKDAVSANKEKFVEQKLRVPSVTTKPLDPAKKNAQILAIEAKLKKMDKGEEEPIAQSSMLSQQRYGPGIRTGPTNRGQGQRFQSSRSYCSQKPGQKPYYKDRRR